MLGIQTSVLFFCHARIHLRGERKFGIHMKCSLKFKLLKHFRVLLFVLFQLIVITYSIETNIFKIKTRLSVILFYILLH